MTKNGRTYGAPLPIATLPSIFRQHPTPMSNRSLDVINVAQRSIAEKDGLFQRCLTSVDRRIKYEESFLNDLVETMFTSLLLRFTGRTKPYNAYAKTMKKERMVPSIVNLDEFLEFMEPTVQRDKGNLSKWISGQHEMAIPKGTKIFHSFSSFIRAVGEELGPTVKKMLEWFGEKGGGRWRAVSELRGMLCRCNNSDTSGVRIFWPTRYLQMLRNCLRIHLVQYCQMVLLLVTEVSWVFLC